MRRNARNGDSSLVCMAFPSTVPAVMGAQPNTIYLELRYLISEIWYIRIATALFSVLPLTFRGGAGQDPIITKGPRRPRTSGHLGRGAHTPPAKAPSARTRGLSLVQQIREGIIWRYSAVGATATGAERVMALVAVPPPTLLLLRPA